MCCNRADGNSRGACVDQLTLGIAWYVVFIASITVHEAAHAFAAFKLGDKTAYHGGQVSLHPLPHIRREPFGTIVVPIITFFLNGWMMGWAWVPLDPVWSRSYPKKAAWVSMAGPAANLILAILAGIVIRLLTWLGPFYPPDAITFKEVLSVQADGLLYASATILSILFSLNVLLFVFNLLPFPPLDGTGWVVLLFPGEKAQRYRELTANRGTWIVGIIVAWLIFDVIYSPLHTLSLNLLYPGYGYGLG